MSTSQTPQSQVRSNLDARTADAKQSALSDARRLIADLSRFVDDLDSKGAGITSPGWWSRMSAQVDVSYARYSALVECAAALDWAEEDAR